MSEPDLSFAVTVLRISRGYSQDQLAKAAGITNSAISEYERGRKLPELRTLFKIVDALGYPLSAIERVEEFMQVLRLERLVEARPETGSGHSLVPVSAAEVSSTAANRARARRVAALAGQAVTGFSLLLFDLLEEK